MIKIGYVSADFKNHSVAKFFEPILEHHNKDEFEVVCLDNNLMPPDDVTKRLMSYGHQWWKISHSSDDEASEHIKKHNFDILVDLSGHTAGNRLPLFARRLAPVQITYLGYPGTTGLTQMDYRITDKVVGGAGTETNLYLDPCMWLFRAPKESPEIKELPAIKKGYVTFGSFNQMAKITPTTCEYWLRIIRDHPNSRLILKSKGAAIKSNQDRIKKYFSTYGINSERITMLGQLHTEFEHMGYYNNIDVSLDTFPYNGTTTTFESLWMGVPVATFYGNTSAGRSGVSILETLGVPVSFDFSDLDKLVMMRRSLRHRLQFSQLMVQRPFVGQFERLLKSVVK